MPAEGLSHTDRPAIISLIIITFQVYEYKTVVEQPHIETHAPVMRMQCQSKISCLSWNP